jgi:glycosyltransferase involved in cell wall biosynthesis
VRILYFADIRFPLERANGIQTMETCWALAERGHEVRLVVRPDTHTPARDPFEYYGLPPHERLVVERAPVSGPAPARRLGYMAFAAGRAAGRARTDVIFTRDLGVASLLLRMPKGLRAPLVYESHGYAPDVAAAMPELVATARAPAARKLRRLAAREARVWRDADGYVTITSSLADELKTRFGARQHLAVVPDGVRLGADALEDTLDRTPQRVVGYAGHLYPWKGVELLLEAIAQVPDAHAAIVGGHEAEPDLARLRGLADRLGIRARVTFTGHVDPPRVAEALRRAAVLALPNPASAIATRFTSPLKLFEYMAANRPIVASDLPSIREVLRDGENALLVPPGDAGALASALTRLLDDRALATTLARNARADVAEYSWARRAERLETLLQPLAGPERPGLRTGATR